MNRHLWQFAPTVHAMWLDLWPAMALEDGELNPAYSDDRLHLNEAGYSAWLAELKPAIERLRQSAADQPLDPAARPGRSQLERRLAGQRERSRVAVDAIPRSQVATRMRSSRAWSVARSSALSSNGVKR